MANVTYKVTLTDKEAKIVEELTGQDLQTAETSIDFPEEYAELAQIIALAIPTVKKLIEKLKVAKPVFKINGEVVGAVEAA